MIYNTTLFDNGGGVLGFDEEVSDGVLGFVIHINSMSVEYSLEFLRDAPTVSEGDCYFVLLLLDVSRFGGGFRVGLITSIANFESPFRVFIC